MNGKNRIKNTRHVTFNKDYKIKAHAEDEKGTVVYEKGKSYYIHQKTAEALKKAGADIKMATVDHEELVEKAKTNNKKAAAAAKQKGDAE